MKKPIFFDLDGTLIAGNSYYDFNLHFGMSKEEDSMLMNWYGREIITLEDWTSLITKILRSVGTCTEEKSLEFVKTVAPRPEALELINICKEKGYTPIIVSGALQQVADALKEKLGIEFAYTTEEMKFDAEGKFLNVGSVNDSGITKLDIFERVCKEFGANPEDTIHVGDGYNDLPIFQRTKKAILLGNHEKLKPLAWKQVQNLIEIADLI